MVICSFKGHCIVFIGFAWQGKINWWNLGTGFRGSGDREPLFDETKILTDTETETFYPRQIFPIPIPRLFFRDQIFRDRYRDFFSETKFSNTDTETFLTRPNFSIPIPRLFFETKTFDTDTETLKKLSWVSRLRPRLLGTSTDKF